MIPEVLTILYPTITISNDLSIVGAATAHEALDDVVPDDDATKVQSNIVGESCVVSWSAAAVDPINVTAQPIDKVSVKWSFEGGAGAGPHSWVAGLVIGGTRYPGTPRLKNGPAGGVYTDYVEDFALDPSDGKPWTKDKIKATDVYEEVLVGTGGIPRAASSYLHLVVSQPGMSTLEGLARTIITKIESLSDITASKTGFKVKGWATSSTPAVYLAIANESKERGPTRSKENHVVFTLPTVVKGGDPVPIFLDLYKRLEEVIEADPSLGGLALDAWVSGVSALVTDEEIAKDLHVSDIFVTVDYRHVRGAP